MQKAMNESDKLLSQVLELPESDRAELAARLLDSLDGAIDPAIDDDWAKEIERRCAASDAGTNVTSDWNDVRQRIERDIFGR
ncbi:MAG TPA: addiction module protein [Thermoanaerobaculia bacterium]|jgi:putative addiction module component (TIGR02574 family)|nr:addiction module protein [Thermoanaerobaculia bacterium]